VRRVSWNQVGGIIVLVLLTLAPSALAAVLNKKARLREGASRHTPLVAWIDAGTAADVVGSKGGWYDVLLSDGRRGFIWGEHLDGTEGTATGASSGESEGTHLAASAEPATLQDELRALREQLELLRSDATVAKRGDVQALRDKVEQLTIAQRELLETLDGTVAGVATPVDGTAVAAGLFLAIGGIIGWVAARMTLGRRDGRGRLRV